jgi:hypothetical protein
VHCFVDEALRNIKREPGEGATTSSGPCFEDLADSCRDDLKAHAKRTTVIQTESCLRKLLDSFAGEDAFLLTFRDLDRFIQQRRKDWL